MSRYTSYFFTKKGGWIRNKSFAYRLTFGSWLVSITVVVYGYQSTLLSRLSVPDINYLATSLDDIAKDQTIMTFALKDSATYVEFQVSYIYIFALACSNSGLVGVAATPIQIS